MNETVKLTNLKTVVPRDIEWLWYPYIAYGKVTIIQGNPGDGKTNVALKIVAHCTNGTALPHNVEIPPINVIYQTAEDGLDDTIVPRLIDAGADLSRISVINEDDELLTLDDERIEEAIKETNAKLLIVDPIQAYLGDIDINNAIAVRTALRPVISIAEKYKVAVLLVGHLNKAQGVNPLYRGIGSMDFVAAVRSILLVGRHKDDSSIRVIVHGKANNTPQGNSIAFRIDGKKGFEWIEGYDDVTAEDILVTAKPPKEKKVTKLDVAIKFLSDLFSDGSEYWSDEVYEKAYEIGICKRTLDEAKKHVPGLTSFKPGKKWKWFMQKPDDSNVIYEIQEDGIVEVAIDSIGKEGCMQTHE